MNIEKLIRSLPAAACLALSLTAACAEPSVQVGFRMLPDPPRAGRNSVEVTVTDASGAPVKDAKVDVRFYMAAMPTMNMPEMQTLVATQHVADGRYRGDGQLVMGGSWQVTVTVTRQTTLLARKKFSVLAK